MILSKNRFLKLAIAAAVLAVASEPMLASSVSAASYASSGLIMPLSYIWGLLQASGAYIAPIGFTAALAAKYAERHDFHGISHGVLNGAILAGVVVGGGGLIGAATSGLSGGMI